jgi:hypothetical protein
MHPLDACMHSSSNKLLARLYRILKYPLDAYEINGDAP